MEDEDRRLAVPNMMPSTYAFNRQALELIKQVPVSLTENEDKSWRRLLAGNKDIKMHIREHHRMDYHLHGKNVSTWDSFGTVL